MTGTETEATPPKLTALGVLSEGSRRFQATWSLAWPAWMLLFSWPLVRELVVIASRSTGFAPRGLGIGLIVADLALPLWFSAAASRQLLSYSRGAWSLNGDFWRYVAAFVCIGLIILPLSFALGYVQRHGEEVPPLLASVAQILLLLLIAIIGIGLSIWPVAQLMGERSAGISTAWQRTTSATWPVLRAYLLVILCVALPFVLLEAGLFLFFISTDMFLMVTSLSAAVLKGLIQSVVVALVASIYSLTSGLSPSTPSLPARP